MDLPDRTDRHLLALLQQDNRQPLRTLAEQIGISAPTCLRRLRRLERTGTIRGHGARVDAAHLGFAVTAHVEVTLAQASGSEMRAFERRMMRCAEVLQCWELAGDIDYLLLVVVRDMPALSEFTRRHLADDVRVSSFRTLIVLRQTKDALLPIATQ